MLLARIYVNTWLSNMDRHSLVNLGMTLFSLMFMEKVQERLKICSPKGAKGENYLVIKTALQIITDYGKWDLIISVKLVMRDWLT